ncbi:MAG TPA: hypothetical protein VHM02_09250, partial [Thermoanaerobaculia bacterium]|nr:hypothetical protein [Thermoanaerobaculia bacterium]
MEDDEIARLGALAQGQDPPGERHAERVVRAGGDRLGPGEEAEVQRAAREQAPRLDAPDRVVVPAPQRRPRQLDDEDDGGGEEDERGGAAQPGRLRPRLGHRNQLAAAALGLVPQGG